ncbi:reverse transcriptase domain-containing protein [Tanacetum coccineum]
MFPLSLAGEAKTWLDELNEGTIKTWDELRTTFISRFFPTALFDRLLGEIRAFSQHENETLIDAWLRMKEMLRNCHGHNLTKGNIIKIFYHGLNEITQEALNSVAGAFADEGSSNSNIDKNMTRMDAMTMKIDAQYKEMQSRSNHSIPEYEKDDKPIQPSGSLPSNTQTNLKGSSSEPYQPPQARNEHVNALFTQSGMLIYGKFLKELISNKHKLEQISSAFLSNKSSAMIQNKVPPTLGDPGSLLIPCTFIKAFSCNALADLDASNNLMPYSLYAKLSLETLKPTKMSVRLADRSFQHPIGIAENMLVEVGKFTYPVDFIILEMKEDSKVHLILGRPFLHTADAVIRVKQKQLNLGVEEDSDALLDEGNEILHSIKRTILEEKLFAEFNEFMAMDIKENFESKTEEPPVEKITFNTDYKINISLKEPPLDLELKPLPDHLEYVFLEEPTFLPLLEDKKLVVQKQRRLNLNMQEVVKEEIVKLLDSGINYPIADSPWVSPVHCVPKKNAQEKYIVTEKELMVVVFAFDKFRPYLILSKTVVYTDHSDLRHLFKKQDVKPRLIRCILLLQEFDIEINDKKGTENVAADHLSRIENDETSDVSEVDDNFSGETLMEITTRDIPWFADFANYFVVAVDYVSKWAKAQALPINNARVVNSFLTKLFCRFVMPKALISDRVKDNPTVWSRTLDDALWAFRTAYKTQTETTVYKLLYGKNCHLPFEIEHCAYWALKNCNLDLITAGEKRMFQLHE